MNVYRQHPLKINNKLKKHGEFGDFVKIKVGIQALWDRAYHVIPKASSRKWVIGKTHLEPKIKIERTSCRPLICNVRFYPFGQILPDVYVIFPYDVKHNIVTPILFSDFCRRFPSASKYLSKYEKTIKKLLLIMELLYQLIRVILSPLKKET